MQCLANPVWSKVFCCLCFRDLYFSLSDFVIPESWKQYLNNGRENVYDLLAGTCIFKVPAEAVKKSEFELLFQVSNFKFEASNPNMVTIFYDFYFELKKR